MILRTTGLSVALLLLPALAFGCINDSDTLEDEMHSRAPAFDVIAGLVPRHGTTYYERRLQGTLALLKRRPDTLEALYDAAGAHMRLGTPAVAIDYLRRAAALASGRYKTHSNLGVAYFLRAEATATNSARRKDLAAALEHTRKGLAIRPGAHFEAGWLYERMIAWELAARDGGVPERTMLGDSYADVRETILGAAELRAEQHGTELEHDFDGLGQLLTLLRAHPEFAEGYVLLGLNLHAERSYHLALRAYVRALDLGHPCKAAITKNIDAIYRHWESVVKRRGDASHLRLMPKAETLERVRSEFRAAERWVAKFQQTEAELIRKTGSLPSLRRVSDALENRGFARPAPIDSGLIDTRSRRTESTERKARPTHTWHHITPDQHLMTDVPSPGIGRLPTSAVWIAGGLLVLGLGLASLTRGRAARRRPRYGRYRRR